MAVPPKELKDLVEKYMKKVESQLKVPLATISSAPITTKEYQEFRKQYLPKAMSWYESACNYCEKIIKVAPGPKDFPKTEKAIKTAQLNITPSGAYSLAMILPSSIAILGSLVSFMLFTSFFFAFFFLFAGIALFVPLQKMPEMIADSWRLKGSNQMVLAVFFMVTYMRHTSNLERAVDFAANHLSAPLSLDLKKILWDVQTDKYENVKESMEAYLETWKEYNMEFVEAMHLIESSLYEGSEQRRVELLEKALELMLEETYEKMLHYAQNLKSPITMLHMLGIILPILGLVILPLLVSFVPEVKWYHLAMLYNITLPIMVYYLGKNILAKRPTGYGEGDVSETNPSLKKYKNIVFRVGSSEFLINPAIISVIVGIILLGVGFMPLIIHTISPNFDLLVDQEDNIVGPTEIKGFAKFSLLEFKMVEKPGSPGTQVEEGPFGLGATLLSLGIPAALGLSIGLFYRLKSQNVIKIRENTKALEKEFASALFQLGNRLADGIPAEIAFDKVANTMENTVSGSFFRAISANIRRLGMGVEEAIFHPKKGALLAFPSNVIESAMKVLVESSKKGPLIASKAVLSVSKYIKEIHRVNERLKDLMADIISSMKSQIAFLTPVISGIVIGITSMVSSIIGKLGLMTKTTTGGGGAAAGINIGELFSQPIPTYYFQLIVGCYVVQIIYIMTVLANGIENGEDKLNEEYSIGQNMIRSMNLYMITAFIVILLFNFIAASVLQVPAA
ncbi:hypothetical protein JXB27_03500 [Candidatus Woesearchaeota archaeon]|nr:hypothetical protein [Candidatus Woesearchaeota archaeon]